MKKVILSLALLAGLTSTAQAQTGLKLGLKGGFNGATFSGNNSKGNQYKAGFAAGGLINYGFSDLISVQGELLYSQKGASIDGINYAANSASTTDGTFKSTIGYIDVPILLKTTIGEDGKGLFFELGPQGSFAISNRDFIEDGGGKQISSSNTSTDDLNKVVIGYVGGIGYQLTSGLGIGIRYTGGISQVYKDGASKNLFSSAASGFNGNNPSVRNSVFQFQAHYMFGGK
ncbi:hypothetical protein ACVWYF_000952 [Hymenobacter sp. UYAg731]